MAVAGLDRGAVLGSDESGEALQVVGVLVLLDGDLVGDGLVDTGVVVAVGEEAECRDELLEVSR